MRVQISPSIARDLTGPKPDPTHRLSRYTTLLTFQAPSPPRPPSLARSSPTLDYRPSPSTPPFPFSTLPRAWCNPRFSPVCTPRIRRSPPRRLAQTAGKVGGTMDGCRRYRCIRGGRSPLTSPVHSESRRVEGRRLSAMGLDSRSIRLGGLVGVLKARSTSRRPQRSESLRQPDILIGRFCIGMCTS